jgi:hypothetical protein
MVSKNARCHRWCGDGLGTSCDRRRVWSARTSNTAIVGRAAAKHLRIAGKERPLSPTEWATAPRTRRTVLASGRPSRSAPGPDAKGRRVARPGLLAEITTYSKGVLGRSRNARTALAAAAIYFLLLSTTAGLCGVWLVLTTVIR